MMKTQQISLDEIQLENVTLKLLGRDAILQSVDLVLPMDQTLVIESSNPQNAVCFLQFLAGRMNCDSGQILWNGENIFSQDSDLDPRAILSSYFENHCFDKNITLSKILQNGEWNEDSFDIVDMFDFEDIKNVKLKDLTYQLKKTIFLIQSVMTNPQILLLEDPAMGLAESHWLQLLDLIQYQQRRGFLRHVYMTNNHPTALRHLAYNKVFIEDGLVYFDENAGYKKASHF
jgi:ABC-type multidrug transport system ATPase subunit